MYNPTDIDETQSLAWENHAWSDWYSLDVAIMPREAKAPDSPGLYRLRCKGERGLIYIGETGDSLRSRLRQLRKATRYVASGREPGPPHVAGACVLDHERNGFVVEVSWVEMTNPDPRNRKGIECELIAAYRKAMGSTNPTCQFRGHFYNGTPQH
ncbi:MAG TPA: hypothetical protein VNM47_14385 [Terriglobia bacterium]|nr:hypothetical protein [Terriglobia bacterium]